MLSFCDAGCQRTFEAEELKTIRIGNGIDKVYFTCPHCGREYVAFYYDQEIKWLQAQIRSVQKRFANPRANHTKAAQREAEIKARIKVKMDALRAKVEGGVNDE